VRRIEAVTGENAFNWLQSSLHDFDQVAQQLNTHRDNVSSKIEGVLKKTREIEKELAQLKAKLASQASSDIETQAQEIEGIKVLAQVLEGADTKTLRETLDKLKDKLGSAAIVLASSQGEKVTIVAGVTKDQTNRIKAGDLVNSVATKVGGKGGGRPDMAQAGGNNPAALEAALKAVPDWVKGQL
jgi:alanyl-tRNA synthetase